MKSLPIPLSPTSKPGNSSIHGIALSVFIIFRRANSRAAEIPGALKDAARDISAAWEDSRPKT